MRVAPAIVRYPEEQAVLSRLARSTLTSVRLARRAQIVPLAADGLRNEASGWLNRVERFFRGLTTDRLRRRVFRSVPELIKAIEH